MNRKSIAVIVGLVAGIAFAGTAMAATFSTNLKLGSTGQDVKDLQVLLNADPATQVASSGVGSLGNETTYFGNLTKTAVIKFQNKYASEVLSPIGLTSGTGFVGALTRAKLNTMGGVTTTPPSTTVGCAPGALYSSVTGQPCSTTTPPATTTGTDLAVTLSSDSPATGGAIVAGQAIADLAHFTFKNNTSSEAKVTKVTLNRTGISNDTALTNVYLYDGVRRVSDSASVASGVISFNDAAGLFTVGAGASKNISVRADISASVAGQIVGVSLASVVSTVNASGSFPVMGGYLSVATATLGTLDFNTTTTPSATTVDPQNDYIVWQNTVTVGTHALNLKSLTLRNIGSISTGDLRNFRLYVDGALLSTVENLDSNGYVTFDLSASAKRMETGSRIVKVIADIAGGSTRTFMMSLRHAGDIAAYDADLNQPVLATAASSTFSARSATSATINGGSITAAKNTASPSSNIAVGSTNVKLATFDLRASGENVKIDNLNIQADTSVNNGGLDNAKVFFNGAQVGSTKDLSEGASTNFTFGSSLVINAGTTGVIDIYADAKTSTSTNLVNTETILITLNAGTSGNAQGTVSLGSLTVPSSAVTANTLTVSSSSLSATKYSGYGNQTMVSGRTNAKIGSFVLSTGASEGANVDTVTVALSATEAASITNLMLKDQVTGAQIGTTKGTPGTSNAFTMNVAIPASGSKVVDIYADILSGVGIGDIAADVTASGTGTLGSAVTASSVTLQTITIGSGTLSLAVSAANPASVNVTAGSSKVKVGQFRFSATNNSYTVEEIKVLVSNNAATSTTGVTLEYKDATGATKSAFQTLTTGAQANATATFTGLSLYVPSSGDDSLLDVFVGIPTISSGAASGAAITATIDYNEGFKATPNGLTPITTWTSASADVVSSASTGYGTVYVRKTIPTFTKVASGVTTPTTGQALYKFDITADTAGAVEVKKISLAVATSTMNVAAISLYEIGNSTAINTTAAEVDSSGNVVFYAGTSANDTVIQVGAGSTKHFEVKGTVTNWGAAGDSLTVSFTEDASAGLTATSASHAGNLVWSDRSATSHTTITADWINGYLVKNFSDDVQSYSF